MSAVSTTLEVNFHRPHDQLNREEKDRTELSRRLWPKLSDCGTKILRRG